MSAAACSTDNKMDIVVRSLYKTMVLSNVDENTDIADFKNTLHQRGLQERVSIPTPAKQRLVFKGSILTSGTLHNAGVRSGDQLVLLLHRPHPSTFARPMDSTPSPTAATIRSAIVSEAKRRGIENTITEEPTRAFRHYGAMPMEVDHQLMQLIQALRGRPLGMEARAGQMRQPATAGEGGGAPQPAAQQPHQQPVDAGGGRRYVQVGMGPPGMMLFGMMPGAQAPAAQAPQAPPPPPVVPEPDPQAATQLSEMGFSDAVVRKALLLHRNELEAALNWLLQHGDDPAAAEPLTDSQLRQIYSRGPQGPPSEPEQVEQLVSMGFDRNQSAAALRRFRNMDMALAYLLRAAEEGEGSEEQQQQQSAAEGAAAPAAGAAGAAVEPPQQQQQQVGGGRQTGPGQAGGNPPQHAAAAAAADARGDARGGEARRGGARDADALPGPASPGGEDEDEEMSPGGRGDRRGERPGPAAGAGGRAAQGALRGPASGAGQQSQGEGADQQAQRMMIDGGLDLHYGEDEEEGDEMDEDVDDDEEEDDDEDDFAGDDGMPTMIEQLAMGQMPGARGTVIHMPLGGGIGMAAAAVPDDALGAFDAPFALYGGAPHGVGATAPALAVTRGPDGNELVLGSAGATMPPLMPARGMMAGGVGPVGIGGAGGGGAGLGPQLVDLPGLFHGGGAGDDDLEMGAGLVQQLLNSVLRDAMGGGEGGGGPIGGQRR